MSKSLIKPNHPVTYFDFRGVGTEKYFVFYFPFVSVMTASLLNRYVRNAHTLGVYRWRIG
jgi:hypothetical protein